MPIQWVIGFVLVFVLVVVLEAVCAPSISRTSARTTTSTILIRNKAFLHLNFKMIEHSDFHPSSIFNRHSSFPFIAKRARVMPVRTLLLKCDTCFDLIGAAAAQGVTKRLTLAFHFFV
jgi:hypothetical protein